MLLPVLRFNPIARQHRNTRKRHVAIMAPLGIGKMRRGAPEFGRERFCPDLKLLLVPFCMVNLCLVFGNLAKARSFSSGDDLGFLPAGVVQVSHNRNYGEREHAWNGSGG